MLIDLVLDAVGLRLEVYRGQDHAQDHSRHHPVLDSKHAGLDRAPGRLVQRSLEPHRGVVDGRTRLADPHLRLEQDDMNQGAGLDRLLNTQD